MLEGAWETIERERATLIVEIEERHHPGRSEQIIQRIASRGYRCWYMLDGRFEAFVAGEVARLQPDALAPSSTEKAPAYVNNFFFLPTERSGQVDAIQDHLDAVTNAPLQAMG
jgi:hypothetical protein